MVGITELKYAQELKVGQYEARSSAGTQQDYVARHVRGIRRSLEEIRDHRRG